MEAGTQNQSLLENLNAQFSGRITNAGEPYGLLTIEVTREDVVAVIGWLQNHETLKFKFLTDLCGVHFPDNEGKELGVVYHLHSLENNLRLRIKTFFPKEDAKVSTLTGLFSAANWMERETFDFYGIQFEGHPDLRRILNVDDMDYFPMRKEYALEDETRTDKSDKFFGR